MESRKRTLIKSLTYRGLASTILAIISFAFTSDASQTTVITVVFTILSTVGYYGHERVWNRVSWEKAKIKAEDCKP